MIMIILIMFILLIPVLLWFWCMPHETFGVYEVVPVFNKTGDRVPAATIRRVFTLKVFAESFAVQCDRNCIGKMPIGHEFRFRVRDLRTDEYVST